MTVDLNATFGHRLLCIRGEAATFISRETLIQSQNQISYGFLYIALSTLSLNSSLFASNVSSLCINIQE